MNALTLLKTDHKTVNALFKQFEALEDSEGKQAEAKKKTIVASIVKELSVHAVIEEQIFYPAIREAMNEDDEDDVLEALEEHHVVKWMLSELDGMSPTEERFEAKVTVLIENVRHHVKEEEQDLFPKVRKVMDARELTALGTAMQKAKKTAPTRPHPRAPDTPPGNIIAGAGAMVMDKARDAVKRMTSGRGGANKSKGKSNGNGHTMTRGRANGRPQSSHASRH